MPSAHHGGEIHKSGTENVVIGQGVPKTRILAPLAIFKSMPDQRGARRLGGARTSCDFKMAIEGRSSVLTGRPESISPP